MKKAKNISIHWGNYMKLTFKLTINTFLLIAALIASGCATSPRTHLTNLKNDFFDISRASVAAGPIGFGVDVKATQFLEVQYDDYEAYRVGWLGRGIGIWHETSSGGIISTHKFPLPYENEHKYYTKFKFGGIDLMESLMNTKRGRRSGESFAQPADEFRLALYFGYFGLDAGVRPLEVLDFVGGLLSLGWLDILSDDQKKLMFLELEMEKMVNEAIKELLKDEDVTKDETVLNNSIKKVLKNKDVLKSKEAFKKALIEELKKKSD